MSVDTASDKKIRAKYFADHRQRKLDAEAVRIAEAFDSVQTYLVGRYGVHFPLGDAQMDGFVSVLDSATDIPGDVLEVGGYYTAGGDRVVNAAEQDGRVWRGDNALSGRPDDDAPLVLFLDLTPETAALFAPDHIAKFAGVRVFPASPDLPYSILAEHFCSVGIDIGDFDCPAHQPIGWDAAVVDELTGSPDVWDQWTTQALNPEIESDTVNDERISAVDSDEIDPDELRGINFVDWRAEMVDGPRPVDWLVPQILVRGLLYQLVGAPKSGKSMLILWLLWRLVTGQESMPGAVAAAGDSTPSGPIKVLVVDKENSPRILADRLLEFGADPETLDLLHYASFPAFAPLDTARGAAQLLALVRHLDVDLVVLDTVSRFVSGNENDSQTYLDLYRHLLAPLKSDGRTVVRIDHTGKDPTLGARGSSAKGGDVDVSWILTKGQTAARLKLMREYDRTNDHPEILHIRRAQVPLRHEVVAGRITISDLADDERGDIEGLTDAQRDLVRELDALEVPESEGRDAVRARLKSAGSRATNVDLGAAIGHRRARHAFDSTESTDDE